VEVANPDIVKLDETKDIQMQKIEDKEAQKEID
jgi:hypothetical protein